MINWKSFSSKTEPNFSYGVEAAKPPFPSPQLQASFGVWSMIIDHCFKPNLLSLKWKLLHPVCSSPIPSSSSQELADSVKQSVSAVKTVKQSIFSLVTSIPKVFSVFLSLIFLEEEYLYFWQNVPTHSSFLQVKVPTFLPITKVLPLPFQTSNSASEHCLFQGEGEWSEGAQTFWQYMIAMLGVAVFLAIQI